MKDCRKKLRILRSLAGSSWGCSKECLVKTYKTHIEPSLYYAPAIWSPNISTSALRDLQRIVTAAARICTGCHASTPSNELIMEAQILPAEDRLRMLSEQSLLSALRPGHVSHASVTAPPGPRAKKQTLSSKYLAGVSSHLTNGTLDPENYRNTIKSIHTEVVSNVISRCGHSRVLGGPRPSLSPSERLLTRPERTALAQLRSGDCHFLGDYLLRVGRSESAVCPECRFRRHTVPPICLRRGANQSHFARPVGQSRHCDRVPEDPTVILPPRLDGRSPPPAPARAPPSSGLPRVN